MLAGNHAQEFGSLSSLWLSKKDTADKKMMSSFINKEHLKYNVAECSNNISDR